MTVNARCGRGCFYCRPSGEGLATVADQQLDLGTLIEVAGECARQGIGSIKLTGGDPALWPPLVDAVRQLKRIVGFQEVHVISRHPKIGELAFDLVEAGTDLINLSVDSLRPEVHREITGINDLPDVLTAVRHAVASGVAVKVNTVVMAGVNDHEIEDLVRYFESIGVRELKLLDVIQDLDVGETFSGRLAKHRGRRLRDLYAPLDPIVERLRPQALSEQIVNQGDLGHPMLAMHLRSGLTVTVKNHRAGAWYGSKCGGCRYFPCHDALMALRLTADLRLQFCLLREDVAVNLRTALANGPQALRDAIDQAFDVYRGARFVRQSGVVQNVVQLTQLADT